MKRSLFLFSAMSLAILFLAFTVKTEPDFDGLLEDEYKKEFVSKTTSEVLSHNLLDVFSHEFDEVLRVDLHQDGNDEFYFVAYGKKANDLVAHMISASEDMATLQYYPSRSDMGISSDAVVINCYCAWIFCLPNGQGRFCGVALDENSPCKPSPLCPIKVDPVEIDD